MTTRQTKTRKSDRRTPNLRSSIYQGSDGRWHGWVTMGIKDDGSPDRRHRTGRTEAEVTAKVRMLENERDAGKVNKPGRAPTVAEWMTTYLDTICARLVASGSMAPRTLDDYRSKTRLWIIPMVGQHRLDRLLPRTPRPRVLPHVRGRIVAKHNAEGPPHPAARPRDSGAPRPRRPERDETGRRALS